MYAFCNFVVQTWKLKQVATIDFRGGVVYVCVCVCVWLDCAMTYVRRTKLSKKHEWVIGLCRSETETETENGRMKE